MSLGRLIPVAALAFAVSVAVTVASRYLHDRHANRFLAADHQLAILEQRPFQAPDAPYDKPEFRGRVLVPLQLAALVRITSLAPADAYLLLRFAWACCTFFCVALLATRLADPFAPLAACTVLALVVIVSFNHSFELSTDFPDILFCIAAIECARRRSHTGALVTTLLAATARESAAFAGVIWWCRSDASIVRRSLFSAVLITLAMACVTALRAVFRLPGGALTNSIASLRDRDWLWNAIVVPLGPRAWYVGFTAGAILLWWWLRSVQRSTPIDRQALAAAAIIGVISVVIGMVNELRVFLPVAACVLMAGIPARSSAWAATEASPSPSASAQSRA